VNKPLKFKQLKIVFTGGPSAGKSSILHILEKSFCHKLRVVPEVATILYSGGFPRWNDHWSKVHTQRAIFKLQIELEDLMTKRYPTHHLLLDRGALDGLAYWPGSETEFFQSVGYTKEELYRRYDAVIHLDPAPPEEFDLGNPVRRESFEESLSLNDKIKNIWAQHEHYIHIPSQKNFFEKVTQVEKLMEQWLKGNDPASF
jgi:predicted ATPase